jgi:putative transcriptional regulator
MTRKAFEKIAQGLEDAIAYVEGSADRSAYRVHIPETTDVRTLRRRLGLSQAEFAHRFGFTVARVRDWEQGRSVPDGSTRAYLLVIEREPEAVARALAAA